MSHFKVHISAMSDENPTESLGGSEITIEDSSAQNGLNTTLSFPASLTGQNLLRILGISNLMIRLSLKDGSIT